MRIFIKETAELNEITKQKPLCIDEAKYFGTDLHVGDPARLKAGLGKVYKLMQDCQKRTTYQMGELLGIPAASAHRHLSTLRTQFGFSVKKELVAAGLWVYWIEAAKIAPKVKKMTPIGDPDLFGEMMRSFYAHAAKPDSATSFDLHEALEAWAKDMVNKIRTRGASK